MMNHNGNAIRNYHTTSKEETARLGLSLAGLFVPGDVVLLKGDLGAGKTTFTGGVAKGLGIEEHVISPTFNIMKCYFDGRIPLYHIDAYRLENQPIEIGLDEYIEGYIESLLPDERLEITLRHAGGDSRDIEIRGVGERFADLVSNLPEVIQ